MPKKRDRSQSPEGIQHLIMKKIKTEPVFEDELMIKNEPVDTGYEYEQHPHTIKTVVYNNDDADQVSAVEAEIGLVSRLEFIKSEVEVEVDEAEVRAFRKEMMEISQDAEQQPAELKIEKIKKTKKMKTATNGETSKPKQKKTEKHVKKGKKQEAEHWFDTSKTSLPNEPEPLEIVVNGVKMVKCRFCSFQSTTRNRSMVKIHMRSHTGVRPYSCPYCKENFTTQSSVAAHVRYNHSTKPIFKCALCRVLFFNQNEFDAHDLRCVKRRSFECHLCKFQSKQMFMHIMRDHMRRIHTGQRVVQCQQCDETFVSKSQLGSHMQHHPEVMPFKCSVCKIRFAQAQRWRRHEYTCMNRRRFECHICKYSHIHTTLDMLKMHMRKHTGEKPFECEHCHKYYPRQEALDSHMQRHRDLLKFKCSKCHRRLWNANEVEKHEAICKKRRYECYLCGFTKFGLSYNKFRRHMITHIGEKYLKCTAKGCTNTFSGGALLARHLYFKHPDLLKLMCPNCHRRFTTRNDRDNHQTYCTKSRFECYLCKQTSISKKALEYHMTLKHTAEPRFECKLCPRKFHMENNLKIHQNVHTKTNLVKCDFCNKEFSHIKYKKKHEYNCKKVYECYLCKKTFPSSMRTFLQRTHMRTHLGARPYDCKHCTKTFVSIRTYNLHVIASHLHQYKFQCNACSGIIVKNKDVRTHQKTCMKPIRQSAGVIYFKCSLCGVGLPRIPELKAHILSSKCSKHPKKLR